jgi:hypothetical protein
VVPIGAGGRYAAPGPLRRFFVITAVITPIKSGRKLAGRQKQKPAFAGLSQCAREDSNLHDLFGSQGPQPCDISVLCVPYVHQRRSCPRARTIWTYLARWMLSKCCHGSSVSCVMYGASGRSTTMSARRRISRPNDLPAVTAERKRGQQAALLVPFVSSMRGVLGVPRASFWRDAGLVSRLARHPLLPAGRNSRLVATGLLGDCAQCVLVLALPW